jgi:hypothetical protein
MEGKIMTVSGAVDLAQYGMIDRSEREPALTHLEDNIGQLGQCKAAGFQTMSAGMPGEASIMLLAREPFLRLHGREDFACEFQQSFKVPAATSLCFRLFSRDQHDLFAQ